jgi:hypothetical protein
MQVVVVVHATTLVLVRAQVVLAAAVPEPTFWQPMLHPTPVAAVAVLVVTGLAILTVETVDLVLSYCLGDPYWR